MQISIRPADGFSFLFRLLQLLSFCDRKKSRPKNATAAWIVFPHFLFPHQLLSHFPLFLYHLFLRDVLDVRLVDGVSHSGHLVQVQRPVWIIQRWFPLFFKNNSITVCIYFLHEIDAPGLDDVGQVVLVILLLFLVAPLGSAALPPPPKIS